MGEIARWNNHIFEVSPKMIRSFKGLSIKGSSETENKTSSSQNYASRKNGNPTELDLTAILNAYTGCNVQKEAISFVEEARKGDKDYFYLSGKKLFTYQVMLVSANVEQIEISNSGKWIRAEAHLSFKQKDSSGGDSGNTGTSTGTSGNKGSQKVSVKTSNTISPVQSANVVKAAVKTTAVITGISGTIAKTVSVANVLKNGTTTQKINTVKNAVSAVGKLINTAKVYSATKKTLFSSVNKIIKR